MHRFIRCAAVSLLPWVVLTTPTWAQLSEQLFITEVMWDSSHPGADDLGNGGLVNGDWWELLNASDEPIDLTGFMWDDEDRLLGNDFTVFPEFVIQPKELIILVREEATSVEDEDGFRHAWGLPEGLRILDESMFVDSGSGDTFSGLAAGGDEINLYDAAGGLIHSVLLEPATTGFSKSYGFSDGIFQELGLTQVGVQGGKRAVSDGSTQRLTDPGYQPSSLDVSTAGHVEGFDIVIPGVTVELDALCTQVASGQATFDAFDAARINAGVGVGDADENGAVDFADFLTLSANFGNAGTHSDGDFDCSGTVQFADFLLLSGNFGTVASAESVPEPMTQTWVCWLLLGLAGWRRRRS